MKAIHAGPRRRPAACPVLPRWLLWSGLLLAACGLVSCARQVSPRCDKTYPLGSLDSLMLTSLESSRVLMLGDGSHGHGAYYRLLTGFLNAWVDTLERTPENRGLPRKLILFLEFGEDQQQQLNSFIATGEIGPLFDGRLERSLKVGGLEQFTTDRMEFFIGLRDLARRIERLNLRRPEPLELEIHGVESAPPADLRALGLKGQEEALRERSEWFVTTRDSVLSERMTSLLRQKPDFKAVLYYGTAHLQRGKVDKGEAAKLRVPRPGFWLAHYLDRALGRSKVKVFFTQGGRLPGQTNCVRRLARRETLPDFEVLIDPVPPFRFPVLMLRTQRTLSWLLDAFEEARQDPDSAAARWAFRLQYYLTQQLHESYLACDPASRADLDALRQMTKRKSGLFQGKPTDTGRADDARYAAIADKLVRRFDALENIRRIGQWGDSVADNRWLSLDELIRSLPNSPAGTSTGEPHGAGGPSSGSRMRQLESDGEGKTQLLMQYMAANLLIIGTPEEDAKAMAFLRECSGLDYETPEEWMNWWRRKYARGSLLQGDPSPVSILSKDRLSRPALPESTKEGELGPW